MSNKASRQSGASLIELIMFIVIVSGALAGILQVMNLVTGRSADALVQKQAQAIAESMLEEIQLQGFTGVNPAVGTANANRTNFDNVFNYNGYSTTNGIQYMDTTLVNGLGSYNVSPPVTVLNTVLGTVPNADAVLITVTVTGPSGFTAVAQGYRTSAL